MHDVPLRAGTSRAGHNFLPHMSLALPPSPLGLPACDRPTTHPHLPFCPISKSTSDQPENPTLSATERTSALSTILPSSASPILTNLLSVLSENGRLASAPKVFADFSTLMSAYRGELEVVVTSAEPLDAKSTQRIEKALKGTEIVQGKTLKVVNRVCRFTFAGEGCNEGCRGIGSEAGTSGSRCGRMGLSVLR